MKKILAFTLAEAILTMTILGVLAATMVANLKPAQYRTKGLVTKAGKVYADLDQATNTIISECTQDISLATTYTGCTRAATSPGSLFSKKPSEMGALYERYMRLTACGTCRLTSVNEGTANTAGNRKCYITKSNANICFYPKNQQIIIDVNNSEGPNVDGQDQHTISMDVNGISSTMPTVEAAGVNNN
jgi:Tfp pilus assembly protein FimT